MRRICLSLALTILALSSVRLSAADTPPAAPELVEVGDPGVPGNPIGKSGFEWGEVHYDYRIGKREVTNAEYCAFLNAKAKDDPLALYDERMTTDPKGGIAREGNPGAYTYQPKPGMETLPVNFVRREDGARYCNWLSAGGGDAETENGVYTILRGSFHNGRFTEVIRGYRDLASLPESGTLYYLPDRHEWYKAGYYKGGDSGAYWNYPNQRDELIALPPALPNPKAVAAAFYLPSFQNPSAYGTLHQGDGVSEWTETKYYVNPLLLGGNATNRADGLFRGVETRDPGKNNRSATAGLRVAATWPLQFLDRLNGENNYVLLDNPVAVLRLRSDAPGRSVTVNWTLRDYFGETAAQGTESLSLRQGINDILRLTLPGQEGYYHLEAEATGDGLRPVRFRTPLAVCSGPLSDQLELGRFGLTAHLGKWKDSYTHEEPDEAFRLLALLGCRFVRFDVKFSKHGEQSHLIDHEMLERTLAAGFTPLGTLPRIASSYEKWNAELPEGADAERWRQLGIPDDMAAYAENVFRLVGKFKGRVKYWELANEPQFWQILPEDYAQSAKVAALAARMADPDCELILGDIGVIARPVLRCSMAPFVDGVAVHIYGTFENHYWGIRDMVKSLRGEMDATGARDKTIWLTEGGNCTYSSNHMLPVADLDQMYRYQALNTPRAMLGNLAMGVDKVILYNFRNVPLDYYEEEFGLIYRNWLPKPAFMAYRTAARLVGPDMKFLGSIRFPGEEDGGKKTYDGFVFGSGNDAENVAILWRRDAYATGTVKHDPQTKRYAPFDSIIHEPKPLAFPASGESVDLVNLMGAESPLTVTGGSVSVPVGEYPVYVRGAVQWPLADNWPPRSDIAPYEFPTVSVQFLPEQTNAVKTHDLMNGVSLSPVVGMEQEIRVRAYNLSDKPQQGNVELVPPAHWRSFDWRVSPAAATAQIPPHGMTTVSFTVVIPPEQANPKEPMPLQTGFRLDGAQTLTSVATALVRPTRTRPYVGWSIQRDGFRLADAGETLRIEWDAAHAGFGEAFAPKPTDDAILSEADLQRSFVLTVRQSGAPCPVRIALRFTDPSGGYHQITRQAEPYDDWSQLAFPLSDLAGKAVRWGGDKDQTVQLPLRFAGIAVTPDERTAGNVEIGAWRLEP